MLRIRERRVDGEHDAPVLDLEGPIYSGAGLDGPVQTMMRNGHRRVVLNLAQVRTLDAAGIGALVGAWLAMRAAGGELVLMCPSRRIEEMLIAVGLHGYFRVADREGGVGPGPSIEPDRQRSLVA